MPVFKEKIMGIYTAVLLDIFYNCHEFFFDGGTIKRGKKTMRTGTYKRLCWPDSGGMLDQFNLIIEIFSLIKNEEVKIDNGF